MIRTVRRTPWLRLLIVMGLVAWMLFRYFISPALRAVDRVTPWDGLLPFVPISCAGPERAVGFAGMWHDLGAGVRRVGEGPPSAAVMRGWFRSTGAATARSVGYVRDGLEGRAVLIPLAQTPPPPARSVRLVTDDLPMDAARAVLGSSWAGTSVGARETAVAVAAAESDDRPLAVNPRQVGGSRAHGLWQIMLPLHADVMAGGWADPLVNAEAARRVQSAEGWGAWDVYRSGVYRRFLPDARRALAAVNTPAPSVAAVPVGTGCAPAAVGAVPVVAGEFPNGQLPDSALTPLTFAPGQRLRPDAAAALERLDVEYRAEFGSPLVVSDSYRSLAGQVAVRAAKPGLAARPGTSQHGLGLAVDLGGHVNLFESVEHRWMLAHAPAFGWEHPAWAEPNGSRPEAWHFEFDSAGGKTA